MRLVSTLVLLVSAFASANAERIVWAKGARHFGHECRAGKSSCVLAQMPSPDHRFTALVQVRDHAPSFEIIQGMKHYELLPGADAGEFAAVEMELLWSPDSSALSLSWNINAITTHTEMYRMTSDGPRQVPLSAVRQDFYHDYPACVGLSPLERCQYVPNGADNTLLAVGWAAPHTLALMAESSESSGYGKNMSQVEGFEVDVNTGKVTRKMTAAEFKKRWQSHMGWTFHIPAPPG